MQLAELNIGRLNAPFDDPAVKEFIDNLERINSLAERMPGFVWRLKGESSNAMDMRIDADPLVISNLSVWESAAQLETFVFGTLHAKFYRRRQDWFSLMERPHFVMWWVPDGHRPSLAEAAGRLAMLRTNGASEAAFGWTELIGAERLRELRCA